MTDIQIYKKGVAGRITLTRPKALNALSYQMCLDVAAALAQWRDDPEVQLVVIDAEGDRAFCAGGDIQELYDSGTQGDYAYGRKFWFDEYQMNDAIAEYEKPVVALMQGFTMGGGVGLGCHARHRVICETSQIAMPEVAIGLIPDVGGTLILAGAPGHMGEYLATTAARLGPGDALHAGFADHYIPSEHWPALIAGLEQTGDLAALDAHVETPEQGPIAAQQEVIDRCFHGEPLETVAALEAEGGEFAAATLKSLRRNSPLAVACSIANIRAVRPIATIRAALTHEFRYTWRSAERGDFIEGIRAQIIDKDRNPRWKYPTLEEVPPAEVAAMLAPLGENELTF